MGGAGTSATFSKSAVTFEDRYENMPGVWGERQSTKAELNCVAHGYFQFFRERTR